MSYDKKSQQTLDVVKAMEEALGANSNTMEKHFHKDFRWMGNQGCGTKNNLQEFRNSMRSIFKIYSLFIGFNVSYSNSIY